jgi:hypothetical protein
VGTGQVHTTYSTDGNNSKSPGTTASNSVGTGQVHTTYSTDGNNSKSPGTTASNSVGTGQVHTTYSIDGNNPNASSTAANNGANNNAGNSTAANTTGKISPAINDSTHNQPGANATAATTTAGDVTHQQTQFSDSSHAIAQRTKSAADSSATSSSGVIPPPQKHASGKVNYFFAEAGMTFIPGFSSGFKSGRSFNPVVGGGYAFRVGMKFTMEAALHYTFVGHASDSSITYTNTTYSFGAQHEYTEASLKRLHYASLPISLTWHVNGKQAITGGVAFNYLFTTETRLHTYSETNSNIKTYSKFGYIGGVNRFDILAMAGYTQTFGPLWSLRLSAYYGFMDVKNNNWYGINKGEHNKGLQFTVQYAF